MYPYLRAALSIFRASRMPPLAPGDVHVVHTRCWPWDIDPFMELNNGRTMTLMDLGRIPVAIRSGLIKAVQANGWRLTMAGACVQYRRRVIPFAKMEIRTRAIGRDDRFIYLEHLTLAGGVPAHNAVYRAVVAGPDGIVPMDRVAEAMGQEDWNPPLPEWVADWAAAEAKRPWPPEM
ncbi:acyl-CoA thioesterase [Rhodovulum sp. DZ06]|uniref:acyl-CoA thioesterase n=1 Tax=Rhodovulum sp. DZ06 TaxID=3425126 RepID=UPI003D341FB3